MKSIYVITFIVFWTEIRRLCYFFDAETLTQKRLNSQEISFCIKIEFYWTLYSYKNHRQKQHCPEDKGSKEGNIQCKHLQLDMIFWAYLNK